MWLDVWWGRGKSDSTTCLGARRAPLSLDGPCMCHSLMSRGERQVLAGHPTYARMSGE